MVKVKVVTKTTYLIDLPIDSFVEISEDNMPISKSNEMIMDVLETKLGIGLDVIVSVNPIGKNL